MNKIKSSPHAFAGAPLLLIITLWVLVAPFVSGAALMKDSDREARSAIGHTASISSPAPLFAAEAAGSQIGFIEPLLTPLVSVHAGHGALGLAKGDFNADGKLDLAATFNEDLVGTLPPSGIVVVMLGNGDGTFQPPVTLFTLASNDYARGILARDFDLDSKLDIVVDVSELHEVLFFKGHGDGTFDAPIASMTNFGPAGVQTADLNGDSKLDLVTVDPGDNAVSVLLGNGDGTFNTPTDYTVSVRPWDVAIGDVNGDNARDLVVGIFGTKVIGVLLNNGSGGFLPVTDFPAKMNSRGLYLADFDGDEILDVMVVGQDCVNDDGSSSSTDPCMAFMKGSGAGTFSSPSSANFIGVSNHSSRQYSENVAPDINGDGKPDVVFTHEEDGNTISIGLSNGNGTFNTSFWVGWPGSGQAAQPPTSYFPDNANGFDALPGDFNGDGVMDFAVPVTGGDQALGGVSIMLGDTPGTFEAPRVYQARGGDFRGADKPSVVFGDFTSNGKVDIAVLAGFTSGFVVSPVLDVLPGNGDGSLADSITGALWDPGESGSQETLRSADLDNNGTLDLLFFHSGQFAQVASGNGNGTFTLFSRFGFAAGAPANMVLADFDGDGFTDVAVSENPAACPPRHTIEVLLQGAGGSKTFSSQSILQVNGDCAAAASVGHGLVAADFDHDGNFDLVASTVTSGSYNALFFKGNGNGTFQNSTVIGTGVFGRDGINDFVAADLNGDSNLDLIGVGNGLLVQLGNGDGTFQAPVNYEPFSGGALKLDDFNGDGKLDIALVGALGVEFSVLPGNGDGTFGAPRKFAVGNRSDIRSLDIADLNGDGQPDLVVKHADVNGIFYTVLINNAQPVPPPVVLESITVSPATASVTAGLTQQFTATGQYSNGSTQDLTTSVTWSSSDTTIATISNTGGSQGLATGVAAGGPVTITAAQGAISSTAQLTVTAALQTITVAPTTASIPKGATQQFTATGHYSDGSAQDLTTAVSWSSSNASIATINSQGLATGVAAGGPVTITAAQGAINGAAQLTVTAAVVVSITITPANAQIPVGASQQYGATGIFSDGATRDLTKSVTWASSNSAVAAISRNGLAKAKGLGASTISASTGGVTGTETLTTFTLAVLPTSATIGVGGTQQFSATAHFADGSTRNLTNVVAWKSSNMKVATINAGGLSQALKTGKTTISAMDMGVSVSATLTVQ